MKMRIFKVLLTIFIIGIAANTFSLMLIPENQSGSPGQDVTVLVKVAGVEKPIQAFGTMFNFDNEILQYKGVIKMDLSSEFDYLEAYQFSPGFVKIGGISRSPIPVKSQGVLFGINFKINYNALPGKYIIALSNDILSADNTDIYFSPKDQGSTNGKINPSGIPPHVSGQELGYFIWYDQDDDTWHLKWSVNNSENKGVLLTDDIEDALTQPAIFTVTAPGAKQEDNNQDINVNATWRHRFTGIVQTDGTFTSFELEGSEVFDKVDKLENNKLVFFATEDLFDDTLVFKTDGKNLTFGLRIDSELLVNRIFIGAFRRSPKDAVFNLEKPEKSENYNLKPSSMNSIQ
jgi:hypothetical protein